MHTDDDRRAADSMTTLTAVGVEGIVTRPAYRPGNRSEWVKIKEYASTEAIIGGVTGSIERPVELLLGRYSRWGRQFRLVGRTVPLQERDARYIAARLTPAGAEHPWPDLLPPTWLGGTNTPTDYVKVQPTVVVEIRVDVATGADPWRYGLRYLSLRTDREPDDVPSGLDIT